MEAIFELQPGECRTPDESDLRDFTGMASSDTSAIWNGISETYASLALHGNGHLYAGDAPENMPYEASRVSRSR